MKVKRLFMFLGGILLIVSGVIEICTVVAGAAISPIAIALFIVASICMIIDFCLSRKEKK